MATTKRKMSHLARCILEGYQKNTKDCGRYLTDDMRWGVACESMYWMMQNRVDATDQPISFYLAAMDEVLIHIGLKD